MPSKNPEVIRRAVRRYQKTEKYRAARKRYQDSGKRRAAHARYRSSEKGRRMIRNQWLRRNYGITIEQRDALFTAQNGVCAICKIRPCDHVDHNHVTNKVRALLCPQCNKALGLLLEDPAIALAAADYLLAHKLE